MTFKHLKQWDRHIHAFVALDDSEVARRPGPLSGVTVGVKDIIDVAGLPTKCGSATRADAAPALRDASVVARLRMAGARIVGKTTTTEFAFTDPTSCRNPHDLNRSPGGSSSGSGAAVAAGIVDIALGTQTAGSLCRPAAYCGVVGFKPSAGGLSMNGVTPLAPSFDTVGIIARNVSLAHAAFTAMDPIVGIQTVPTKANVLCGLWNDDTSVQEGWSAALADAGTAFDADVSLHALPADIDTVVAAHRTVMCAEAAVAHRHRLEDGSKELLRPKFRAGLEAGIHVTAAELRSAKTVLSDARQKFWKVLAGTDLVLTLPVPDGAPLMGETTGFQDWLTPWTVFGGPLLCLPWGVDRLSRPQSVMLAAHPGQDLWLLQMASELEAKAPGVSKPKLPI